MKNFNFTRILFLITSLIMLIAGVVIPDSNLTASVIGSLAIVSLVAFDIQAPKIAKLSKNNLKVKTMRFLNRLTISIITICTIFTMLSPIKSLFSAKTNEVILVGLLSIVVMVFGNLSPKIPFNRHLGLRLPWTIRDEDTWRIAHRILGYLSFPMAIVMFVLNFYFSEDNIAFICILIWVLIPSLYSLLFYYKKMKGINV